jgi:hypothetical protein
MGYIKFTKWFLALEAGRLEARRGWVIESRLSHIVPYFHYLSYGLIRQPGYLSCCTDSPIAVHACIAEASSCKKVVAWRTTWKGAPWARINLTFHPALLSTKTIQLYQSQDARPIPILHTHTPSIRHPNLPLGPLSLINRHRSLPRDILK